MYWPLFFHSPIHNLDHQVWLTNIEHLREHRLGDGLVDEGSVKGRGLDRRRDVENIVHIHSQIQSVTPPRAWLTIQAPQAMGEIDPHDISLTYTPRKTVHEWVVNEVPPPYHLDGLVSHEAYESLSSSNPLTLRVGVERLSGERCACEYWRVCGYSPRSGESKCFTLTEKEAVQRIESMRESQTEWVDEVRPVSRGRRVKRGKLVYRSLIRLRSTVDGNKHGIFIQVT